MAPFLVRAACEFYGITEEMFFSNRRKGEITPARWAVAKVLMENVGWSMLRIGQFFGKDHTSILYGARRSVQLYRTDPLFFEAVSRLQQEILSCPNHSTGAISSAQA